MVLLVFIYKLVLLQIYKNGKGNNILERVHEDIETSEDSFDGLHTEQRAGLFE